MEGPNMPFTEDQTAVQDMHAILEVQWDKAMRNERHQKDVLPAYFACIIDHALHYENESIRWITVDGKSNGHYIHQIAWTKGTVECQFHFSTNVPLGQLDFGRVILLQLPPEDS
jgi:hypothetical protein